MRYQILKYLFCLIDVEVHPDGLLIIRNAQANDAGRYR